MDMFTVCWRWTTGFLPSPSYIVVLIVKASPVCGEDDGHGHHAGVNKAGDQKTPFSSDSHGRSAWSPSPWPATTTPQPANVIDDAVRDSEEDCRLPLKDGIKIVEATFLLSSQLSP